MELTDSAAAERARKGDQNAFRVLVERYSHTVFRLAFRMTGNEQDAEDVVQETFLRAFKQIHRFDARAAFSTWLYRICSNCAIDSIRKRKNRKETASIGSDEESESWLDRIAAPGPTPERLLESAQIAGLLQPALQRLTDMERTAFVLRHYEGCDIQQVAEVLGVQPNAAKHTVFRAVQKVRCVLEPVWRVAR